MRGSASASVGAPFLLARNCYLIAMRIEYLFASSVTIADQAARKKGWRPAGRASSLKSTARACALSALRNNSPPFPLARGCIKFARRRNTLFCG